MNAWITACDIDKIVRLIDKVAGGIYLKYIVMFCAVHDHPTVIKYIKTQECNIYL